MSTKVRLILMISLALLAGAALWTTLTQAAPEVAILADGSPAVVAYQGEVRVSGTPYSGDGYFKFAVINAAGSVSYWSNDGSSTGGSEPTATVQLAVNNGLFSVLLGDTTLSGMTQALTADVFDQPDSYLRVWFSSDNSTFRQLAPDTRIAAVPYALQAQEAADADTVDGLHANQLATHYQNVIIVAKSGGDYTSVQTAIGSITDATANNPYLVWVAPGVYSEMVTMKPHVHLQGAGQEATIITSDISSSGAPTQATLILASDVSLRDLTVSNNGTGTFNVALLATSGTTRTRAENVTAKAQGSGTINYAIYLTGSGTDIILQQVAALAENGSGTNLGLYNSGAVATLHGGSFTGRGGGFAKGILNYSSSATLEAISIIALGENGSNNNTGIFNYDGAAATLHSGSFTGRGGTETQGISTSGSGATLTTENVAALGENGSDVNIGLLNNDGAAATLRSGSFTARGGADTYGINNADSDTTMETESVTVLAENGTATNIGLYNDNGAEARLHSGSFTGHGGIDALGISNSTNSILETESVTALAEDGSGYNYGLTNIVGAEAILLGGSFTGHGGNTSYGIHNADSNTMLITENITALGKDGNTYNYGLYNGVGTATLRGSSFIGQGGISCVGILTTGSGSTLTANNVTALGENGSSFSTGLNNSGYNPTTNVTQSVLEGATYSIRHISGSITVSNSRLVGGAVFGSVTCVAVSRNTTFNANGCP